MHTIKIFIASSDELLPEREKFDTLFAHLNKIFSARGIRLEASKWEFLDSSMGLSHKQEEYNREIKTCDICVVMFWKKFGDYTNIELKVADEEMRAGRNPKKVYVFFKEPGDCTSQIKDFKANFEKEYGHFYGKFDGSDKLQLDFVLQLERFLNSNLTKIEDSQVKIDGVVVAHLDNIGFASGNEKYKSLRNRLTKLEQEIASLDTVYQAIPNETIENMLNEKKRENARLKEELSQHEEMLLGAAIKMAKYTGERISDRMKRAILMFEEGKVSEANVILDESERDADDILKGIKEVKSVGKQSVDELIFRTSVMLADDKYQVEERIFKVEEIYEKAIELANECSYEEDKYISLLFSYTSFLETYAKYENAEKWYLQLIELCEKIYGKDHLDTAAAYNNIGLVYRDKGDYDKALEYYFHSLEIFERMLGIEHSSTSMSYYNIGNVYCIKGDYDKALEYFIQSLKIREKVLGKDHPFTASSYHTLGNVFYIKGDYDKALEYYFLSYDIKKHVLGKDHIDVAAANNDIGLVYQNMGNYDKALEYYFHSLEIFEKMLGKEHSYTSVSYFNIGNVFCIKGDYDKALEYSIQSLKISEKVLGKDHPSTASSYHTLGNVFYIKGDYDKALEHYFLSYDIKKHVLGKDHIDVAAASNDIGLVYQNMGDYDKALEYYFHSLEIFEKIMGEGYLYTANSYNNIGLVFYIKGDYDKALEYYFHSLEIFEKILGEGHLNTANSYNNIGLVFQDRGEYDKAMEYLTHAFEIRKRILGDGHLNTADSCYNIGLVFYNRGEYGKAMEYLAHAFEICEKLFGKEHPSSQSCIEYIEKIKLKKNEIS